MFTAVKTLWLSQFLAQLLCLHPMKISPMHQCMQLPQRQHMPLMLLMLCSAEDHTHMPDLPLSVPSITSTHHNTLQQNLLSIKVSAHHYLGKYLNCVPVVTHEVQQICIFTCLSRVNQQETHPENTGALWSKTASENASETSIQCLLTISLPAHILKSFCT